MHYEGNKIGILDGQGQKEHSMGEMVGEGLSEKVVMAKVFACQTNP